MSDQTSTTIRTGKAVIVAPVIDRLLTALKTGKPITALRLDGLGRLSRHKCWREAMQAISEIDTDAHPDAQMMFLKSWVRVPWQFERELCGDDIFIGALRKLTPAYRGPAITLYRGQLKDKPVGLSWTRSLHVGIKFALYGDANVDPHNMHRAKRPPRTGALVLAADVTPDAIISAPCLHGFKEGEFIVDPRAVRHRVFIDYSET